MMNLKFSNNLVVVLILLYSTMATFLTTERGLDRGFVLGLVFFALYYLKNKKLIKLPPEMFVIFGAWFLLNISTIYILEANLIFPRVIHYFITLMLLPVFTLLLVGNSFWHKLESVIYLLTKISLPLFVLNIVFQSYFNSAATFFHYFTYDQLANGDYWSALIYVNAIEGDLGVLRNSGFMWEPGAFAMMIIFGLGFNWLTSGFNYNGKFFVYLIALITTFSTAGYLSIVVLIMAKYTEKRNLNSFLSATIILTVFAIYVYSLPFVGGEIDDYMLSFSKGQYSYYQAIGNLKANRFVGSYLDLIDTFKYPFGYGVVKNSDIVGGFDILHAGGLANLLKMWGIPVFVLLLILLWKYFQMYNVHDYRNLTIFLIYFALLMMFFSNPIDKNSFVYLLVFTPIIFRHRSLHN